MRYIRLKTYGKQNFEGPPSQAQLCRWAREGLIPGAKRFGREWWVDTQADQEQIDPLLAKIIEATDA